MSASLRITEIFRSLQGEASTVGYPTVFVRLTGCPLRCVYCDSEYAFYGGERQSITDILAKVQETPTKYVCVTGGEPLAQPDVHVLMAELCERGYSVSLETSGAMDISQVDPRVSVVMDLKTPASGEQSRNRWQNIDLLQKKDQLKFVICNRDDFDWMCFKLDEHQLSERVSNVLVSPSYGQVDAAVLAEWLLSSGRNLRFQVQLHKQLWGDKPGV